MDEKLAEKLETLTGEDFIIAVLINIEGRMTVIETNMTWFKYAARGGIITIAGFLGINLVGLI